jgi:hypothetical protein
MFQLRGVDGLVVWSDEGEEEGGKGSDAEGDAQGREDGCRLKLETAMLSEQRTKEQQAQGGMRFAPLERG